MSKIAVIGSCVCDVIIRIPHLPKTSEDINVHSQHRSIGGCAFNVANILHLFQCDYVLFSPIGEGMYGDFVRQELQNRHMHSLLSHVKQENGCCYCLVEDSGERTFLSVRGAEYRFQLPWFDVLQDIDMAYLCGLEIEEDSALYIISYLEQHPSITVYFAPGPRICHIDPFLLKRIFSLSCILHLNDDEAKSFTQANTIEESAEKLFQMCHNTIIITCGAQGAYLYRQDIHVMVEAYPAEVVDTIGAGDSHIGAYIAAKQKGLDDLTALRLANQIASLTIRVPGGALDAKTFLKLPLTSHLPARNKNNP